MHRGSNCRCEGGGFAHSLNHGSRIELPSIFSLRSFPPAREVSDRLRRRRSAWPREPIKSQSAATVFTPIYPDSAARTAFFKRNESIFNANGSATIEQVIARCMTKMAAGFDEVRKMAGEVDADVFGDSVPDKPNDPISSARRRSWPSYDHHPGASNGINQQAFLDELKDPLSSRTRRHGEGRGRLERSARHKNGST